tara:strand:- start:2080 stop:2502 length:423 start_codon:yes stop_codon:yes gene_type:complete
MQHFHCFICPLIAFAILLPTTSSANETAVSFKKDIKPVLREKCVHCHNKKILPDRVSFESASEAFTTTKSGQKIIVPGAPEKSLILLALEGGSHFELAMPQTGPKPSIRDIQLIRQWIAEGAKWPNGWAGLIRPTFYPKE